MHPAYVSNCARLHINRLGPGHARDFVSFVNRIDDRCRCKKFHHPRPAVAQNSVGVGEQSRIGKIPGQNQIARAQLFSDSARKTGADYQARSRFMQKNFKPLIAISGSDASMQNCYVATVDPAGQRFSVTLNRPKSTDQPGTFRRKRERNPDHCTLTMRTWRIAFSPACGSIGVAGRVAPSFFIESRKSLNRAVGTSAKSKMLCRSARPFVPEPPACFAAAMILLANFSCSGPGAVNLISSTSRLGGGSATAAVRAKLSASSVRFCSVFSCVRSFFFINAIA